MSWNLCENFRVYYGLILLAENWQFYDECMQVYILKQIYSGLINMSEFNMQTINLLLILIPLSLTMSFMSVIIFLAAGIMDHWILDIYNAYFLYPNCMKERNHEIVKTKVNICTVAKNSIKVSISYITT